MICIFIYYNSDLGFLKETPGVLSNDFFSTWLDMQYEWKPTSEEKNEFKVFREIQEKQNGVPQE